MGESRTFSVAMKTCVVVLYILVFPHFGVSFVSVGPLIGFTLFFFLFFNQKQELEFWQNVDVVRIVSAPLFRHYRSEPMTKHCWLRSCYCPSDRLGKGRSKIFK